MVDPSGLVVAVAGLGFGEAFVPIYRSHPLVADVVLVDPDDRRRHEVARRFGLDDGLSDLGEALADPRIDAVHVLAPVHLHADLVVASLEAGKHTACAVPMATTDADLRRVIAAEDAASRTCMMMETSVYAREFLTVQRMVDSGGFGDLTLYRGEHVQNLDGFPRYWQGFPPMHYLTHALSPLLALTRTTVESVRALGAGTLADGRRTGGFGNPFPTEVGLFRLAGSDVVADVTMSFFQTARDYLEGFSLYGSERGVEWPRLEGDDLTLFTMGPPAPGTRGNAVERSALAPADFGERLPEPLRRFTRDAVVRLPDMPDPVAVPAHHGGSHAFLVDEFVSAAAAGRRSAIDARRAAEWTAPGISAHESAMAGGTEVEVPVFP